MPTFVVKYANTKPAVRRVAAAMTAMGVSSVAGLAELPATINLVVEKLEAVSDALSGDSDASYAGVRDACSILARRAKDAAAPGVIMRNITRTYDSCMSLMQAAAGFREAAIASPDAKRQRLCSADTARDHVSCCSQSYK